MRAFLPVVGARTVCCRDENMYVLLSYSGLELCGLFLQETRGLHLESGIFASVPSPTSHGEAINCRGRPGQAVTPRNMEMWSSRMSAVDGNYGKAESQMKETSFPLFYGFFSLVRCVRRAVVLCCTCVKPACSKYCHAGDW